MEPVDFAAEVEILPFGPGSALAGAEVVSDVVKIAASADQQRWTVVIVVD